MGLDTFTARQVQENVFFQHRALAVSSLLLVTALSCISFGCSMGLGRSVSSRSADFSLFGEEEEIDRILQQEDIREMVGDSYPMHLSMVKEEYWEGEEKEFDESRIKEILASMEGAENILENFHLEYVIAESSYNRMLGAMGEKPLDLEEGEVALYTSMHRDAERFYSVVSKLTGKGISIGIDGRDYTVRPQLCYDNVVADRAISIYLALIVPDEMFAEIAREPKAYCRNVHLTQNAVKDLGLMQAVQKMDMKLAASGIEYDSFLGGIGRNLFYTVAASYLTVYLGVLFLLIANTVIGLKFLIQQRQTKGRYVTLSMLGAGAESMRRSVKKQIQTYFLLVLAVSLVSSGAAIITMFTSFAKLPVGTSPAVVAALAAAALIFFAVTETIYIGVVKRMAGREIVRLEETEGEFL